MMAITISSSISVTPRFISVNPSLSSALQSLKNLTLLFQLRLFLLPRALSGSTLFPVLLMSIWWKRCNVWGAICGLLAGFAAAVIGIVSGDLAQFGLSGPMAAAVAAPISLGAVGIGSLLTPAPDRHALEMVRDLRVPGGDTLYDREVRQILAERRRHTGG